MAQDVYITRAAHHFDGAQTPITQGDWRALIENDPDLKAPDEAYPSYAVWAGPTRRPSAWIDWANGNVFSRSPDEALLRKLIDLAELLGASVQGHGGEIYRLEEDRVVRDDPLVPAGRVRDGTRPSPIARESEAAVRRIAPNLEDILDRARPSLEEAANPPEELSSEVLFGPRPRNVDDPTEVDPQGADLHADASFAPSPDALLPLEPSLEIPKAEVPFRVGQRVRTEWGRPATIVSVDCAANGGLGQIEIRYDDGRVATTDCVSHGLEPMRY